MPSSFNQSNFLNAMKHVYKGKVENLVYPHNPAFGMIPKETTFPGRNCTYAVEYGVTSGRSATFSTAQANRGGTKIQDFVVTRVKDYAVVSLDNETLLAADGNEGSLLDVAKAKTDSALHALSRSMGRDMYRSGTGSLGKVHASTGPSSATITLVAGTGVNYEVGMRLVASAADGGTLRAGVVEVTAVNRDGGSSGDTLTVSPGVSAITSLGTGDFLYVEGDAANGGTNLKMAGFDAWLPETVGSGLHFGVNRTADATRLGGQRQIFGGSIQQTVTNAAVKTAREGGRPDVIFMNPTNWATLALDLEGQAVVGGANNRRRYDPNDRIGTFGFSSLSIATPSGMVDVYADHNCPIDVGYLLQLDTWKFKSLGSAPQLLNMDGNSGIRQVNEDGVEYRWGYYGNLLCTAPGFNCRVKLA